MGSRIRVKCVPFVLLLLLLALGAPATAQNGLLAYGSSTMGTISTEMPRALFDFDAAAGDLIAARVIALSDGFDPTLGLLSPAQELLASNDDDFYSPGGGDAAITLRLPETGVYALLVGGAEGTTGDFLLLLDVLAPLVSAQLSPDAPARRRRPSVLPPVPTSRPH